MAREAKSVPKRRAEIESQLQTLQKKISANQEHATQAAQDLQRYEGFLLGQRTKEASLQLELTELAKREVVERSVMAAELGGSSTSVSEDGDEEARLLRRLEAIRAARTSVSNNEAALPCVFKRGHCALYNVGDSDELHPSADCQGSMANSSADNQLCAYTGEDKQGRRARSSSPRADRLARRKLFGA